MFRMYRLALLAAVPSAIFSQSEAALKRAFEGKRVIVGVEMPATKWGIDVGASDEPTIDFRAYSQRIKEYGTAIRPGDSVMVTGVKVKDSLIEFQLGGGGYGTLFDDTDPNVHVADSPRTRRERNLEKDLKYETDPRVRRRMKEELEDLRSERHRDDRQARAVAAEASESKRQYIRGKAMESGSRFNLRYPKGYLQQVVPTPEMVMRMLDEWIDFGILMTKD